MATKVLVTNDEDPYAKKVRTQELKRVRNIEMLRTRLRRSNWNPNEKKYRKKTQQGATKL